MIIKLFFLFIALLFFFPIVVLFLFFIFPPTRRLAAYFLNKKFQKMSKNGHVYYRSFHFQNGKFSTQMRDVTPTTENIIDVTPISNSNLREALNNENTAE